MGTVAFDMVIALVIASFASASALSASCAAVVDTSCGAGVLDSAKANASSAAAVVDKRLAGTAALRGRPLATSSRQWSSPWLISQRSAVSLPFHKPFSLWPILRRLPCSPT